MKIHNSILFPLTSKEENGRRGKAVLSKKILLAIAVPILLVASLSIGVWLFRDFLFWNPLIPCFYEADWEHLEKCNFTDADPETVFREYVWHVIPTSVKNIEAVEGMVLLSWGPAFVKFEASTSFIDQLIEDDGFQSSFVQVPCTNIYNIATEDRLVTEFPNRLGWWNPLEAREPVCFQSQGPQADDFGLLLFDRGGGSVWFYQSATCVMCPD